MSSSARLTSFMIRESPDESSVCGAAIDLVMIRGPPPSRRRWGFSCVLRYLSFRERRGFKREWLVGCYAVAAEAGFMVMCVLQDIGVIHRLRGGGQHPPVAVALVAAVVHEDVQLARLHQLIACPFQRRNGYAFLLGFGIQLLASVPAGFREPLPQERPCRFGRLVVFSRLGVFLLLVHNVLSAQGGLAEP